MGVATVANVRDTIYNLLSVCTNMQASLQSHLTPSWPEHIVRQVLAQDCWQMTNVKFEPVT